MGAWGFWTVWGASALSSVPAAFGASRGCSRAGLQGALWPHSSRRAGAARSARLTSNRKPQLWKPCFFVFRCSKPVFQRRKWKRETKRALFIFFSPPPLSLWFLFVILYFYNKHKPLERQRTKYEFFLLLFTVNFCNNNRKKFWTVLDGLFLVSSYFSLFFFLINSFCCVDWAVSCLHFNFGGRGKEKRLFCRNTQ